MDGQDDRDYSRAPELEDLLTLCQALNAEGVKYVLIGGFAVILHGFVRATKDIDLLVDASPENIQRLKRAMAVLPDNAIALIADDEVEKYQVVRIADEIVVDLLKNACGVDYSRASRGGIEIRVVEGVEIPLIRKELLIETKQTVRPSDAADVQFLRLRLAAENGE
ncbi:MAG: nucleotidyltransferase [Thermoanaerobaculia bacterium]